MTKESTYFLSSCKYIYIFFSHCSPAINATSWIKWSTVQKKPQKWPRHKLLGLTSYFQRRLGNCTISQTFTIGVLCVFLFCYRSVLHCSNVYFLWCQILRRRWRWGHMHDLSGRYCRSCGYNIWGKGNNHINKAVEALICTKLHFLLHLFVASFWRIFHAFSTAFQSEIVSVWALSCGL